MTDSATFLEDTHYELTQENHEEIDKSLIPPGINNNSPTEPAEQQASGLMDTLESLETK